MRLSWKRVGALLTGVLLVVPVLAQFQPGGFRAPQSPAQLVTNKLVQAELKLKDEQIAKLKEIDAAFRDELERAGKDRLLIEEVRAKIAAAVTKELPTLLTADQRKRVEQIEIQFLGLDALTKASVVKNLELTDDQARKIEGLAADLLKDIAEVRKEVPEEKVFELLRKVNEMKAHAFEKATGLFTEAQAKAWKELTGAKFELKFGKGGKGF